MREYLIHEAIDQATGLDAKKVFDELIANINNTNLSDMPGGAELMKNINQYSEMIEKLEATGNQVDIEDKLMKMFQFNGEFIDLANNLTQYKYSPGNVGLLLIQGAPNQLMGTANWWAKRGMKLKPGAKFKVVLRPIFSDDSNNDYTTAIKNEIYQEYPVSALKLETRSKLAKIYGDLSQDDRFKAFEVYNILMGKPRDAKVDAMLNTMQGRNELSQFMLTAYGLKPSVRSQGYHIGHLYSRDQVMPAKENVQRHPDIGVINDENIRKVEGIIGDIVDGFRELNGEENDINQAVDETGAALFHDVITQINQISQFGGDEDSNLAFFTALLDLNDRIDKMRRVQSTYQYTTRNLLFLAMQADNLTEVGPRTYWFIQNKRPKRDAHGKIILTPITEENPQELAKNVIDREITGDMIKNNAIKTFLNGKGISFSPEEKKYTASQLYNIYYNLPIDNPLEDLPAWDFRLARFYLDLTGLKSHLAKGFEVRVVYDITDVEPIPGADSTDKLVEPTVRDISYDGDPQKLVAIKNALVSILSELRSNKSLAVDKDARAAISNKCLYHGELTPTQYKTPAVLTGKGKERDGALYDFDLMRADKPVEGDKKSLIISEIGRLLHLLVHEISHYNRGVLSSNYDGAPKSQADFIYHDFLGLKPGSRIYYNPNDMNSIKHLAKAKAIRQAGGSRSWDRLSPEDQEKRISAIMKTGSLHSGLLTNYTEKSRYYRETQAEVIAAMVMRSLSIPITIVGTNLALLSNIDGTKDLDNTPANETQFYIDTANAILRKIHSKLDRLDEHHKELKIMIEQILNNKGLLN